MTHLRILLALVFLCLAGPAAALTCSASVGDITFGTISLRSGVSNQTSAAVTVSCSGAVVSAVGACLTIGPGSGGAGAGNSPRYMRRSDGTPLSMELRPNGNGAINGTWTSIYMLIPIVLGSGSVSTRLYADITSSGVGTPPGAYSSTFSGASNVSLTYGVALCGLVGTTVAVPAFQASATVSSSCEVDSAALYFGEIGSTITGPIDASTTITVRCTDLTSYSVQLGLGSGAGATGPADRRMTGPGGTIRYGLYQDAGRGVPWGNTVGSEATGTGSGNDQSWPVYGRIHAGQSALPGLYTDNVVVTVTY